MASFLINNLNAGSQQNLAAAFKTLLSWNAATGATTLRRVWLTECEWGATDVPNATDCPVILDISRMTAAGTGTTLTPTLSDDGGGDAAALATYTANYTAEPTVTAATSKFFKSINQRASDKQWWRDKASCPISAAVNLQGYVIRVKSPNYASTYQAQASVEE
jgi:hypothetical protein